MRLYAFIPLLLSAITSTAASGSPSQLTTWEQIHQTLHTYPLAVDFKQASLYPQVFANDAFANYTGPLANLTGIDAIREGLMASVASLISQHQLGTTVIDIHDDGVSANSTTYFTATLFTLMPNQMGSRDYTILYGLYSDQLKLVQNEGWRISTRYLEFMAPNLGNLTLG